MGKPTFEDIKFWYNCRPQLWDDNMVKKAIGVYITKEQAEEILNSK